MASNLWELLNKYKIVIPIMQRDYAQGRTTGKVPTIRENLLNSICSTIQTEGETLQLDFIYGYTKASRLEEDKNRDAFYPLDGQQRLTTLLLLHWYIAAKEGHLKQVENILANFSYETRHSSKVFCAELVKYMPISFEESIQASIINQPWFFAAWRNDPTIQSMLTMLDAIQQKVEEYQLTNVWQRLIAEDAAIVFHLLPMDELGLPDDLYIKMNSRGKELTDFEYYKVRLSEAIVASYSDEFNHKIDKDWYDLIWDMYKYSDDADIAQLVDSAFLRLLRYLTDFIIEKNDLGAMNGLDELGVFDRVYSVESNAKLLFNVFDKLVELRKYEPEFFPSIFYINEEDFSVDKTKLFFQNPSINLLKKCADSYDPKQRNNPFSLGEQLLLYACIIHIINKTEDFNYRIRKIRNLISNSEDTVRKENLRSLLLSIEEIVLNNNLDADAEFSSTQMFEEGAKVEFLDTYPAMKDTLFKLEDHQLLQGCTAIFELSPDLDMHTNRFFKLFHKDCNYDLISCALFTFDDYSQKDSWRTFLGSSKKAATWRELFTPSQRRSRFENTKKVLLDLLKALDTDPPCSVEDIIASFLHQFQMEPTQERKWNYYFIKYDGFRRHEDGYYYWPDEDKAYECIMFRRKSTGGFHWDPFLFSIKEQRSKRVTLENNYGGPLMYSKGDASLRITAKNDSYILTTDDPEGDILLTKAVNAGLISSDFRLKIIQSIDGLDIEDRVAKGIQLIDELDRL